MLPVITQVERIAPPDLRKPARMPSWPAWVASRIASLRNEVQSDSDGKWREIPTLPENLTLTKAQRDEIGRAKFEIDRACALNVDPSAEAEAAILIAVTKMMLVLPAQRQNEASAEARGEAYMAALEDLPPWAVDAAIRSWYRGEAGNDSTGEPFNCSWCPSPADLRIVARRHIATISARGLMLGDLLKAETLIEFSDEHCAKMRARLATVIPTFSAVGKDGGAETFGLTPDDRRNRGTRSSASPA